MFTSGNREDEEQQSILLAAFLPTSGKLANVNSHIYIFIINEIIRSVEHLNCFRVKSDLLAWGIIFKPCTIWKHSSVALDQL